LCLGRCSGWTGVVSGGRAGRGLACPFIAPPYPTGAGPEALLFSQHRGRLGFRVATQKLDVPTWTERVTNDPEQGVNEVTRSFVDRSEERRVGKECRSRVSPGELQDIEVIMQ